LQTAPGFSLTNSAGTATVTVSSPTVTYDGNPHVVAVSTVPAGLEADIQIVYTDGVSAPVTCTATDSACGPVNAGSYAATATIIDNPNYGGAGSGTLTIERKATMIVFDTLTFVYSGGMHA